MPHYRKKLATNGTNRTNNSKNSNNSCKFVPFVAVFLTTLNFKPSTQSFNYHEHNIVVLRRAGGKGLDVSQQGVADLGSGVAGLDL
jgi:hypothetical protein